ncbi:unnamed protein product [Caenorhabditis bovis]|uniref:HEPN domain-containing protein n=1 Tax=Caenorhabditis bovis TaxID=2654633 RepID=A0A8S1EK32_9PELO|nr:unnamed protein product [Caenorhabditis bovis]
MEQYTATTFIEKARFYLSQSPPDLVQSSEKIWFAAVYAVKKLFLTSGGIDLKSHKALNYFCRFALANSGLTADRVFFLFDTWTKAEKMDQDVYGSWNFCLHDYAQIITDVETFVKDFDNFDQRKLWDEFERKFIVGTEQNVTVKKVSPQTINLGGFCFKSEYSVFV